jgi:hypothetical protein
MADLVVIVGVIAFFAICIGLVWACDRIIGPDPDLDAEPSDVAQPQEATR